VACIDRTAYPRFTLVVTARELAEGFTPTTADGEWARRRKQDVQHLLVFVLWLKSKGSGVLPNAGRRADGGMAKHTPEWWEFTRQEVLKRV